MKPAEQRVSIENRSAVTEFVGVGDRISVPAEHVTVEVEGPAVVADGELEVASAPEDTGGTASGDDDDSDAYA